MSRPDGPRRGRGAVSNRSPRHEAWSREAVDDGWAPGEQDRPPLPTTLIRDSSRSAIAYNDSPDVPFDRSVNTYRGCEHGCIYCYARPSHAWLGLSPGLDFETRLVYKPDAAALLRRELAAPGYRCAPVTLGANTDAYQPVERRLRVTREVVEVLHGCHHPLMVITKSALVERDLDLLVPMAEQSLARVAVSVTTLDRELARCMEPRAAAPERRLQTIRRLSEAGVPVSVLFAPVIPFVNDAELERVLSACHEAGARAAHYIVLRLPREVGPLFREWLEAHRPLHAERVMGRIRDMRGGHDNDPRFGARMSGEGAYAGLLAARFERARRRTGFSSPPPLDRRRFVPPAADERQLRLL